MSLALILFWLPAVLLVAVSDSQADHITIKRRLPGDGCISVQLPSLPNSPVSYHLQPGNSQIDSGLVFAIVLACDKSGGHEGCAAIADGTEAACVAATPDSAGGERQVSDGEYTSPAGSAAQLLIRNTAPAAKQIDLVVELQPQQQMSTVHSPVGGETVTSPVGGETVTTYRRSLLEAPARSGIDSVGISDKQRTTSERPLGGRRSLLADSDTQDTLDKIKGTKIKFSSFIEDITNKVPKKHRKTVKIVIIVAIVLACLVALCCLWCLIKIVLCPCCCAAKMLK